MLRAWHLRSIILLTLISLFMGVIYFLTGPLYDVLSVALAPAGLQPMANDILLGIWVMAGPLAAAVIKLPGSALLGELLAAAVEALVGGQWGAATLISGIEQGLGSELGFTFTGYKNYSWFGLSLSAVTGTIITFIWDFFRTGYSAYGIGLLAILFFVRLLSFILFGVILTKLIVSLLERTHLLDAK